MCAHRREQAVTWVAAELIGGVHGQLRWDANVMNLRRPASVPIRIRGSGFGSMTVDGNRQSPSGAFSLATPRWVVASARYDLDVESGIGALVVESFGG